MALEEITFQLDVFQHISQDKAIRELEKFSKDITVKNAKKCGRGPVVLDCITSKSFYEIAFQTELIGKTCAKCKEHYFSNKSKPTIPEVLEPYFSAVSVYEHNILTC